MNIQDHKIDVIIPTYRPDEKVVMLLKRLLKQSCPVHEIHVVDTITGVFPEEIYELSDKIRVTSITKEEFDHGGTRGNASEESEAEFVVFMTQDAMPLDTRLLENLILPFEDDKVAVSYARHVADNSCGEIEKYTRIFNYPKESSVRTQADIERLGIKAFFCSDVCAAYRKSAYHEVGGFVKKTIFNEDAIIAANFLKAGYKVAYAADARVLHCHNYNCMQQFKRNFDLAVSQTDHPEVFENIKSESEGIRLVKNTAVHLWKIGKPWLIISLIMKSGFKYMGYLTGKRYRKLPGWMILKCTSNVNYWKKL